jgi:hypothetical protein
LAACTPRTPANSPQSFVVVPSSDNTLPTGGLVLYDPDPIKVDGASQPVTVIAVSDVVTIIAGATDEDGGIKSVRLWATYTYYKPGQIQGPGLASTPVKEDLSPAKVGESTLKNRFVTYNVEVKNQLAGWSSIKVDVWMEAENFGGGTLRTPVVSITYPTRQAGDTDYMAFCRIRRVPIPPDWAESGSGWALQGNLRQGSNLLQPGEDAFVWTYSDPVRRGACIALPRGTGTPNGSLAGIICQSATTGAACFWDNRKRDDSDPMSQQPTLGWKGVWLKISELKDASNLTEQQSGRCTDCHRGNNAFLMSPDDPTWAKVLRGPLVTTPGSTFTTHVESSPNTSFGHPRYDAVTYPSNRPDWKNPDPPASGCSGSCHESFQLPQGIPSPAPMPPSCAAGGVENCYR